ncbi:MAG: endonuclease/exonuclease/phosphatase family protein [Magnetococcales bacterium]|nr:endonuclease/exonuclease/phosphatase family protein [Magnetococcales bacterium]
MVNFLFWNIHRQPLGEVIAQLVAEHDVDVLMLAECGIDPLELVADLNDHVDEDFFFLKSQLCERILIFSKFGDLSHAVLFESDRWTIRRLRLYGGEEILLVVAHLYSKRHADAYDQLKECESLMQAIRGVEQELGHARTLVAGDFNLGPFEDGMTRSNGMNAVMSRAIAERKSRTVDGRQYDFFYNPMWGLLGDGSPGPPGTCYYASSRHTMYWYQFDQVLVRPDLLDRFDHRDIRVLTEYRATSLLGRHGTPNASKYSDHLPLFFRLC